jgi:hypothetical protein
MFAKKNDRVAFNAQSGHGWDVWQEEGTCDGRGCDSRLWELRCEALGCESDCGGLPRQQATEEGRCCSRQSKGPREVRFRRTKGACELRMQGQREDGRLTMVVGVQQQKLFGRVSFHSLISRTDHSCSP